MVRFHRSARRQGSWISIFAIFLIGAGLLVEIGAPSGAQRQGGDEKRFGDRGRRSLWRGVTSQITWIREMEAPGDYNAILQGYSAPPKRWLVDL